MQRNERVKRLLAAAHEYAVTVRAHYDEVVDQVVARAAETGSLGELDLGALTGWKRMRADTLWMAKRPAARVTEMPMASIAPADVDAVVGSDHQLPTLSWRCSRTTADDAAHAWAVPAQPPSGPTTCT